MTEKQFQSLLGMAKSLQLLDHNRADFWRGFQWGLRRFYHGENFGTNEEHEKFYNCRDDEYRRDLQTGYRAGYHYNDLKIDDQNDVQTLRQLLGRKNDSEG